MSRKGFRVAGRRSSGLPESKLPFSLSMAAQGLLEIILDWSQYKSNQQQKQPNRPTGGAVQVSKGRLLRCSGILSISFLLDDREREGEQ